MITFKLAIDFAPFLGVGGFVWFLFPVRNVTFDEVAPYIGSVAQELGTIRFDLGLRARSVWLAGESMYV